MTYNALKAMRAICYRHIIYSGVIASLCVVYALSASELK